MGPDGAIGSKTRAVSALINPSVTKGCTEWWRAEFKQHAGGSVDATGPRRASAPPIAAAPLLGMEPVDTVPAHQGWVAPGHLVRTRGQDDCYIVTASTRGVRQVCNAAAGLAFPSAKCLVIPTVRLFCPIRCTGRTPLIGIVQHFPAWCLLSEGSGPPPSAHTKQLPPKETDTVRRGRREDGVAFSAREKPLDACTPAARREGRVAVQGRATTPKGRKR
jgi:hypothetical protein